MYSKMPGIIFDIKEKVEHLGPGTRTAICFKGCPLSCYWCPAPESQNPEPEMGWWEERCERCGTCVDTCPEKALRLEDERVIRDYKLCRTCAECAKACPNEAMEKIGDKTMPQVVLEKIVRDKKSFHGSGGMTLTGGEPTMQEEFLLQFLAALKGSGIHTAVKTCGLFDAGLIDSLLDRVDLFLYDLRHMDPEEHSKATGADNEKIKENFVEILGRAGAERVMPGVPLVNGFNTYMQTSADIIKFIGEAGYRGPVRLMPRRASKESYERIGRGHEFVDTGPVGGGEIERIKRVVIQAGLEPVLYE
jgi:pyruvate formate lyase activating enzyme